MNGIRISTKLKIRAVIVFAAIAAGFTALAVRIYSLQTTTFDFYQKKVIDQLTTESTVTSDRGSILDTNGELLATNITSYRIFISPSTIQSNMKKAKEDGETERLNLDETISRGLSDIVGVDYEKILQMTTRTGSLDATVVRQADGDIADRVLKFVSKYKLGDMVYVEAQNKRFYPYGDLAAHVIGFTGTDGYGLYGLEYTYNDELSGTPGRYITARDSYGNEMPYEYQSFIEATDGYDLNTTIDIKIQSILEEQLERTYIESGSLAGVCGTVLNVKTGAVYGMATYPDFNINDAWTLSEEYQCKLDESGYAEDSAEYSNLRSQLLTKMWSNKAITDTMIPGSTFKIITTAMALETASVRTNETFTCTGSIKLPGIAPIHCHNVYGHGKLTFAEGLQQSCNPILITVGQRIGTTKFYDYVRNFGYLERTGIDLPGEARGIFYDEKTFTYVDLAVASFGQNFKVSIIQHLSAIASVANGGRLIRPYLVESMTDADGNVVWQHDSSPVRQVISGSVCKTVADILEDGVSGNGGAKNAYVAGYRVAAKTGTSEKIGDNDEMRIGSCVAFAPADDPEIAIIIVVDEPTLGSLYGSVVAAPYIANCLEQMLPYLGVEAVYTEAEAAKLKVEVGGYLGEVALNAKTKIEKLGLDCDIVGVGTVVTAQVPEAGSQLSKDSGRVILYVGDAAPENSIKVPNVVGMTASAANRVLVNAGFNISIKGTTNYTAGSGAVVYSQYPESGTPGSKGDIIEVTFRYLDVTDD